MKFLPRDKFAITEAATQKARQAGRWISRSKEAGWGDSQVHRPVKAEIREGASFRGEAVEAPLPGKPARENLWRPYPKPTQVVKLSKLR